LLKQNSDVRETKKLWVSATHKGKRSKKKMGKGRQWGFLGGGGGDWGPPRGRAIFRRQREGLGGGDCWEKLPWGGEFKKSS